MTSNFATPAAAPAAAPAAPAPVEIFSETSTSPASIESEIDAALDGPLPEPEAPPAAPASAAPDTPETPEIEQPKPESPEPVAEESAPAEAAPAAPAAAAEPSPLPEGVKLRQVDGAQRWVMDPKVGESLAARASLVESAAQILGEPLTENALKFRQDMMEGWEGMRGDLLSDDPTEQANVVAHFENVIQGARVKGEVGHDALSGFTKVVIDRALDGYIGKDGKPVPPDPVTSKAIEEHVTRRAIDSLYQQALSVHDPAQAKTLWSSAQQADKHSFGVYRPLKEFDEGRLAAPPARFERRAQPAQPAANAAPPSSEARAHNEYRAWHESTNKKIGSDAVRNVVEETLAHIPKEQREKFPAVFSSLRDQLSKEISNGFRSDPQLQNQVEAAQKRARLAVNPDIRNQLMEEIVRRHATKAAQILKDKKGPILSQFAELLAAKSNDQANRVRTGAAAGRNAAPGGGPSAARSNPQPPGPGKFQGADDPAYQKEMDEAFA